MCETCEHQRHSCCGATGGRQFRCMRTMHCTRSSSSSGVRMRDQVNASRASRIVKCWGDDHKDTRTSPITYEQGEAHGEGGREHNGAQRRCARCDR